MPIQFFEEEVSSALNHKPELCDFLEQRTKYFRPRLEDIELTYVFCSDDDLLKKNIRFLNHHTLTDILTFDLSEKEHFLTAEIYISIDRVKENAEKYGCRYQEELHRVIFHGLLHLCGFKDKSKQEKAEMRRQERNCIAQYFKSDL